jgi:hypothetical protein
MKMKHIIALMILSFASFSAFADDLKIKQFLPDQNLKLVGSADYSVFIFDIFEGYLWSTQGFYNPEKPHALQLRYQRDFTARALADSTREELIHVGIDVKTAGEWADKTRKIYPDVTKGGVITAYNIPSEGTIRFYYNDTLQGEIKDKGFSENYLKIWLSDKTSAQSFYRRLFPKGKSI